MDTSAYPLTHREIENILAELEEYRDSDDVDLLVEEIYKHFKTDKIFSMEVNAEYLVGVDDLDLISPPVEFELMFGLSDIYWGFVNIPLQAGLEVQGDDLSFNSNLAIFTNLQMLDIQVPDIALSSFGGEVWNFSFGRDKLSYGEGTTGKLMISSAANYHDYMRVKAWGKKFRYNFTILSMEAIDIDDLDSSYWDTDDESATDVKLLFSHNLDINLLDNLRITINEGFLRGDSTNILPFFNPLSILHNLALTDPKYNSSSDHWLGNSVLTLGVNYTPVRGLGLYGEYIQDQFLTASESSRNDEDYDGEPNAFGYLFGFKYSYLMDDRAHFLFNGEYVYTNPNLYRSTDSMNLFAYTWTQHSLFNNANIVMADPLGYFYGPDVQVIKFGVLGRFLNYKLNVGVDYLYIVQGERTLTSQLELGSEGAELTTPTGDASTDHIVQVDISYTLSQDKTLYIKSSSSEVVLGVKLLY